MQLTPRAKKIIHILLRFPADKPVTIGIIAEELGVSERSVQRELASVEKWLKKGGFAFVRKRSAGLFIDESPARREEIAALLGEKKAAHAPTDSKRERRTLLCHDLLLAEEPLKSFYFTEKFLISEGTLAADLNELEGWFSKYHLRLVRRPGLGILLEGEERHRRQALTAFICRQVNAHHSIGNLQRQGIFSENRFIDEIDGDVMEAVNGILSDCQTELSLQFSDNGYLHLLVYTALAVQRMQKGQFIRENETSFAEVSIRPEYAIAEYFMRKLRAFFNLSFSVEETIYLAVFISGQRIYTPGKQDLTDIRNLDVHQISLSLIKKIGELLGVNFVGDSRLLTELSGHIQPAIARLRAGIPEENPFLEEFRARYPDIYKACEEGLSLLCPLLGISAIPASEVGFITVYFAMARDRIERQSRQITVMIVCPTGIGSSRLLTVSLKKEYPDLLVRGIVSAFEIDIEKLKTEGIDLVISTVRLEIAYPYLQVNPILTRQDKILLDSRIKVLQAQKKQDVSVLPSADISNLHAARIRREDVDFLAATGQEIYALLASVYMTKAPILKNKNEIIAYAASLYADSSELQEHLYEVLLARDRLADTYVKPFEALLLHGRSPRLSHSCFGYVRLEPPVYDKGHIIRGAVVSLIPSEEGCAIAAPVTSEAIGALLEEPDLLHALSAMDRPLFVKLLENVLLNFYRTCAMTRLGLKDAPER